MKTRILTFFALSLTIAFSTINAGKFDATVRAFENNADYIRPFSSIFGTLTNSGWYRSAGVDKNFGFYIGLPISITYVSEKDRSFDYTYVDEGCQECKKLNGNSNGCLETQTITVPTIFGREKAPSIKVVSAIDQNGNVTGYRNQYFSDGLEDVSQFRWLPSTSLQLGVSWYYTSLQFRFITVPTEVLTLSMPAFSLQHDLKSILPNLPIHLSLAGNATIMNVTWKPNDENIDGSIKLSGLTNFLGVLAGYQIGVFEAFLQTGWEHSFLKTSGNVTIEPDEVIKPSVKLVGRNAFRIGLNVAMNVGYTAVVGHSFGSEMNTTVNIFGYSYQKK
jgi:hypothetical protein